MDYKSSYSKEVLSAKELALTDESIQKNIAGGENRRNTYGDSWEKVDINEVLDFFTPTAQPRIEGPKVAYDTEDGKFTIYADMGGGYLRVFDRNKNKYVGLHGELMDNYIDENGKQQGLNKKVRRRLTHFKIKHKEDM